MLTTIASYSFPYEAHIARAKLESEGIPAFVADEHTISMQWLYSNALGGVRLQVADNLRDAALKILNEEKTNIVTIEDPIEYTLEGINQVQLKEDIGLSFSSALRSFLRQDPDVIMLGEIRDGETAQMAIRAALTGHLVLSTIHTNSAWGTISRMIDMGVPSYLLASTLSLSVAQRLVRILCSNCKEQKAFNTNLFPSSYKAPRKIETHFEPVGCEQCFYTGYKGRKAVYEVIPIDYELSEAIKNEKFNIREELAEKGINQLMDNAFQLFEKGETSIDEVYAMLMSN